MSRIIRIDDDRYLIEADAALSQREVEQLHEQFDWWWKSGADTATLAPGVTYEDRRVGAVEALEARIAELERRLDDRDEYEREQRGRP